MNRFLNKDFLNIRCHLKYYCLDMKNMHNVSVKSSTEFMVSVVLIFEVYKRKHRGSDVFGTIN